MYTFSCYNHFCTSAPEVTGLIPVRSSGLPVTSTDGNLYAFHPDIPGKKGEFPRGISSQKKYVIATKRNFMPPKFIKRHKFSGCKVYHSLDQPKFRYSIQLGRKKVIENGIINTGSFLEQVTRPGKTSTRYATNDKHRSKMCLADLISCDGVFFLY